jgi:hypothetical protein
VNDILEIDDVEKARASEAEHDNHEYKEKQGPISRRKAP